MREFRTTQTRGRSRFWSIDIAGDTVTTMWGDITDDGKRNQHGETSDTKTTKGKADTKAFVNAEDNARFQHDRLIRKKLEEGYREVGLTGVPLLGATVDLVQHDQNLPKSLCFSKPKNSVSQDHLNKADGSLNVIYTRKVNGMSVIAQVQESGKIELYTRRMDLCTEHFPHLVQALGDLRIPEKTVMIFEAFLGIGCSKQDLLKVQSVMRSHSERALELQKSDGWVKFCLLRMPFLRGEHLEEKRTFQRLIYSMENSLADRFFYYRNKEIPDQFLFTMDVFEGSSSEALLIAREHDYEGWVGYVRDGVFGERSYTFNGKPDRPPGCFKIKPDSENDFIAYWNPEKSTKARPQGTYGTGKNQKRIGSVSLYQLNPQGDEVYLSEVASGLSDEERDTYADPSKYPLVMQIKYEERFYISQGDKTNALHLPRVMLIRTDKDPSECVDDQLT